MGNLVYTSLLPQVSITDDEKATEIQHQNAIFLDGEPVSDDQFDEENTFVKYAQLNTWFISENERLGY